MQQNHDVPMSTLPAAATGTDAALCIDTACDGQLSLTKTCSGVELLAELNFGTVDDWRSCCSRSLTRRLTSSACNVMTVHRALAGEQSSSTSTLSDDNTLFRLRPFPTCRIHQLQLEKKQTSPVHKTTHCP